MKILITGATGFLGRRIVAALSPRHELRLLVRSAASRERFPESVEFAAGDVTDRMSLDRAFAGCDAVLHAAALVKIDAPAAEFDRVNIGGLENVLAAAAAAKVGRLVYVSSFIALGPTERGPGGELDESAADFDRVWINDYERTKTVSDQRARLAIASGVPLSVVYPGVIYGPGELTEGNILVRHLLDLAHGRLPALVGKAERRWNYAFVEDVAAGVVATLERGTVGRRYLLGGENVSQAELYRLVGEIGRIRVPKMRMPDFLATASGAVMKTWARWTGGVPRLTPDLVEIYRHDWAYDSKTAIRELGYRPRSLRDGLSETVTWLRGTGAWPV
ncbi:MAG: NAD-dependent epimerase/dehydratase family protein [Thermoanaerobaculia bacterium]